MRAECVGPLKVLLANVASVEPDLVEKFYGRRRAVGAAESINAGIGGQLAFLGRL